MSLFKESGVLWNFLLGIVFLPLLPGTSGASIEIFQENPDNNSQQQAFASESFRTNDQNIGYFGEGGNLDETQTEIKSSDEKTSFFGVKDEDISFLLKEESKADVITLDSDVPEKDSTSRVLSAKGYRGKTRKVTPLTSSATGHKPKSLSSSVSTARKDKDTTGKLLIASQPSRDLNFDEGATVVESSGFPYHIPLPYTGGNANLDLSGRTKSLDVILAKTRPKLKRKFALDLGEYSKRRFRRDKKDRDSDDSDNDTSDEEDDDDDKEGCKNKKHHSKPQDTFLDDVTKFPNNLLQNQAAVLGKLTVALENIVKQLTFLKQKFTLRLIKITDKDDFNQMPNVLKDFNVTEKSPMFIIVGGIKLNSTSKPDVPPTDEPEDCESKPGQINPTSTTTASSELPQTTLKPETDLDPTTVKPEPQLPTTTLLPSSEKPMPGLTSTLAPIPTHRPVGELPSSEKPNGELPNTVSPATIEPISELPTTEEPASELTTTDKPVSELTTEKPVSELTTEKPASELSTTEKHTPELITTKKPPSVLITTEKPTSELHTTEKSPPALITTKKPVYEVTSSEKPVSELIPGGIPTTPKPVSKLPVPSSPPHQTVLPATTLPPLSLTTENHTSEIISSDLHFADKTARYQPTTKQEALISEASITSNLESVDTEQHSRSEEKETMTLIRHKRSIAETNMMDFDVHSPTQLLSHPFTELFDVPVRLHRRTARTDSSFDETTFIDPRDSVPALSESMGEKEKDAIVAHVLKGSANKHPPGFIEASFAVDNQAKTEALGEGKFQGSGQLASELIIPQPHEQFIAVGSTSDAEHIDQSQSILSDVSLSSVNKHPKESELNGVENAEILHGIGSGNVIAPESMDITSNEQSLQEKEFGAVKNQDFSSDSSGSIVSLSPQKSNAEGEMQITLSKESLDLVNDSQGLLGKSKDVNAEKVDKLPSDVMVELNVKNINEGITNTNPNTPFVKETASLISESGNSDQQATLDAIKLVVGGKNAEKADIAVENVEKTPGIDSSSLKVIDASKVDAEKSIVGLSEKEDADSILGSFGGLTVTGNKNVDDSVLAVKEVLDNGNVDSSVASSILTSKTDAEKVGNEKIISAVSVQDTEDDEIPFVLSSGSKSTTGLDDEEKSVVSIPVDASPLINEETVLDTQNSELKDKLAVSSINTDVEGEGILLLGTQTGSDDSVIKESSDLTDNKNEAINLAIASSDENPNVKIAVASSDAKASEATSQIDQFEVAVPGVSVSLSEPIQGTKVHAETADAIALKGDTVNEQDQKIFNAENISSAEFEVPLLVDSQNIPLSVDLVSTNEKGVSGIPNAETHLVPASLGEGIKISDQSLELVEGKNKPEQVKESVQATSETGSMKENSGDFVSSFSLDLLDTKKDEGDSLINENVQVQSGLIEGGSPSGFIKENSEESQSTKESTADSVKITTFLDEDIVDDLALQIKQQKPLNSVVGSKIITEQQSASDLDVNENVSIDENSNNGHIQTQSIDNAELGAVINEEDDKSPLKIISTKVENEPEKEELLPLSLQTPEESSGVIAPVALDFNSGFAGQVSSADTSITHEAVDELKDVTQRETQSELISTGTGNSGESINVDINSGIRTHDSEQPSLLLTRNPSTDETEKIVGSSSIENDSGVTAEVPLTGPLIKQPLDSGSVAISTVSKDVDSSSALHEQSSNIGTKDVKVVGGESIKLPLKQEDESDEGSTIIADVIPDGGSSTALHEQTENIDSKDVEVVGGEHIKLPLKQEGSSDEEFELFSQSTDEQQGNPLISTVGNIAPVSLNFNSHTQEGAGVGGQSFVTGGTSGSIPLLGNSGAYTDPNQPVISVPINEYPYHAVKPSWFDTYIESVLTSSARKEVLHSYRPIPILFSSNAHKFVSSPHRE